MASVFVTNFDIIHDLWVLGAAWGLPPPWPGLAPLGLAPGETWPRPPSLCGVVKLVSKTKTNPQVLQPMEKLKDKIEDGDKAKTEKAS